jgi:hypothetical protein
MGPRLEHHGASHPSRIASLDRTLHAASGKDLGQSVTLASLSHSHLLTTSGSQVWAVSSPPDHLGSRCGRGLRGFLISALLLVLPAPRDHRMRKQALKLPSNGTHRGNATGREEKCGHAMQALAVSISCIKAPARGWLRGVGYYWRVALQVEASTGCERHEDAEGRIDVKISWPANVQVGHKAN